MWDALTYPNKQVVSTAVYYLVQWAEPLTWPSTTSVTTCSLCYTYCNHLRKGLSVSCSWDYLQHHKSPVSLQVVIKLLTDFALVSVYNIIAKPNDECYVCSAGPEETPSDVVLTRSGPPQHPASPSMLLLHTQVRPKCMFRCFFISFILFLVLKLLLCCIISLISLHPCSVCFLVLLAYTNVYLILVLN